MHEGSSMAFNVSDEVLSVYVPVMVYWTVAAIYTFIGTYLEDYRLHPVGAEEKQNVATKAQVIRGVLYQQIGQIVMQTIVTKVSYILVFISQTNLQYIYIYKYIG